MKKKLVVCIGAALIDETYHCQTTPLPGTSNPALFYRSAGGVARNIANHLALLGDAVELISHFGNDPDGIWLMEQCQLAGIGISNSLINDTGTGRYVAMLSPGGDLFAGAVSTHFERLITPAFLQEKSSLLKRASLLQIDCNLSSESLDWLLRFSRTENINCIVEPVSVPKAARLLHVDLNQVLLMTPNRDEMKALTSEKGEEQTKSLIQQILARGVKYLWLRNGKEGSGMYATDFSIELAAPDMAVIDTTGAGDAALAGWIHAWLCDKCAEDCVRYGHAMASLVLQVNGAIQQKLTLSLLEETFNNETLTI